MLMGRMRSATMRHAICTVSGHTSQVTCLARTLSWKMRRWTTELLKECVWATTSALPCSGCTRSSCARWYVSAITATSTTFCLSYVLRIFLTALTYLSADDVCKMHEEDGDKVQRMPLRKSTRFRITASGEPVLVTPDSGASDADWGQNSGSSMRGSQMRRSRIKNRNLLHSTRCS
jgi:hypothetical protein